MNCSTTSPASSDTWTTIVPLVIGSVATVLLVLSMLAQLRVYYVSKDVTTMSYGFIFFQMAVNVLYLIYNLSVLAWPVLVGNMFMIVLLLAMLGQKYYYTHVYTPTQYELDIPTVDIPTIYMTSDDE